MCMLVPSGSRVLKCRRPKVYTYVRVQGKRYEQLGVAPQGRASSPAPPSPPLYRLLQKNN